MEMLHLVPEKQSYNESRLLREGLTSLRTDLVQKLLENCSSVKVKRLFMVLAERLDWPWVKELNLKKINFGKGKRVLQSGGKLHPKYLITLHYTGEMDFEE